MSIYIGSTPEVTNLEHKIGFVVRSRSFASWEPVLSAAAYGYGSARNHCFSDGNKRIALAAIDVFLIMNDLELIASEAEAVITISGLAAGGLTESDLAEWIENNAR